MAAHDDPLSSIEAQLQDLHAALLASDPLTLEQGASALRQAAAALAQAQGAARQDPHTAERVRAIAAQLSQLRDQLARVLALTQQQAATLLPPVDAVTYGGSAPTGARIYRAPG